MCHRPELAGLDASKNLLRGAVKNIVVVLDELESGFLGASGQRLKFREGPGRRFLDYDVGSSEKRVHGELEVGGRGCSDVDYVWSRLLQHLPVVSKP